MVLISKTTAISVDRGKFGKLNFCVTNTQEILECCVVFFSTTTYGVIGIFDYVKLIK